MKANQVFVPDHNVEEPNQNEGGNVRSVPDHNVEEPAQSRYTGCNRLLASLRRFCPFREEHQGLSTNPSRLVLQSNGSGLVCAQSWRRRETGRAHVQVKEGPETTHAARRGSVGGAERQRNAQSSVLAASRGLNQEVASLSPGKGSPKRTST